MVYLYSIYDLKTEQFGPIFTARTDVAAVRMVKDSLSGLPLLAQHPADFSLHSIGIFDEDNGDLRDGLREVCQIAALIRADVVVQDAGNGELPGQLSLLEAANVPE